MYGLGPYGESSILSTETQSRNMINKGMYYYLYQITNLVNHKIYVGVHKTRNLNDGYMGSGKIINAAIAKYGIDNFRKDVLEYFSEATAMYAREKDIVTDEFLLREDTYNLRRGGFGGFDYINANPEKFLTEKRLAALMSNAERQTRWRVKYDTEPEFREVIRRNAEKANKAARSKHPDGTFTTPHSADTIQQMKETHAANGHQQGSANSQHGTMWIHSLDLQQSKKIKKGDPVPQGWQRGRKIKF